MRWRLLLAIIPAAVLVCAVLLGARWVVEATTHERPPPPLPPTREILELFRV